jgi:hypothetical protein
MISKPVYAFLLITSWVVFFLAQVLILREIPLTILAFVLTAFLMLRTEKGEWLLLFLGIGTGLVIEVGLGMVARTQHFDYASLFGVPFWLPIIWGYGFVAMRRIGNSIVSWVQER